MRNRESFELEVHNDHLEEDKNVICDEEQEDH